MRRPALLLSAAAVLAALAGGCGGSSGTPTTTAVPVAPATTAPAPPPATTAPAPSAPTLTSQNDLAECNELESNIRIVSQLVSSSVDEITHSRHPKDLARHTGATRRNLLFAASVLTSIEAPRSLVPAKRQLVAGLRLFAADFGRAQISVEHDDIAKAAQQLVDRPALAKVTAATQKIDRACGG